MGIRWNKDKVKFIPSTGAGVPDKYELEVFQGDSIDLLDFVQFIDDSKFASEATWKTSIVNAAYYTDNGANTPSDTFKPEWAEDDEVRQYASKKILDWNVELKGGIPDPFGIANLLVNNRGIMDTSISGISVNMEADIWVNFTGNVPPNQILTPPENKDTDVIKKLTVKIKSNSFLGEGGLLNSVTGSIDKYVTDAMQYVTDAIAGGVGYIGEGVGWGIGQVSSLFGAEKPKGYNRNDAKKILDEEKEREQSVFGTILGYPAGLLSFITARENAAIIKQGLKTISLATRLYRAYTQGKTALVTAAILAKIETLLDFEKLTRHQQIVVSRFLGTNPKTIKRICGVAKQIIKVERMVSNGDYTELQNYVLQEMDKKSVDELDPELQALASGEIFEDTSTGAIISKKYTVVDKDTVTIEISNPKFSEMPGNNLILTRIEIESLKDKTGDYIPIEDAINEATIKSGLKEETIELKQGITLSPSKDKIEIVYPGIIGNETGTEYRAHGVFPDGKDKITLKLNNTKYDPLFEFDDAGSIKIGYIKLGIKYHYMGNTQPMIQKQEFDPTTRTYVTRKVKLDAADVLLSEGETTDDSLEFEGTVPNSYAEQQKKSQSTAQTVFETTKTGLNAIAVYDMYKKKQFLTIFDAVDFKNLPKPVQGLIVTLGGTLGISSSEIIRYYEVLSGAKNLYELSTKGFQHYNSLPPELKAKISKQLGVSEGTLGEVIPLAGDLTDMATGKKFNKPGEKEAYLQGLFDRFGGQLLNSFGPNGEIWEKYNRKLPDGKWDLTRGDIDPKLRESIARAFGFTDLQELKPGPDGRFEQFNGEDITHKEVPGLAQVKCGRLIAKGLQFRDTLAKGIALKNRLLEKYERVKNSQNALENEELMLGMYDDIVETGEAFDKGGVLSQIYDDAEALTQDPYADFLDSYGDEDWRTKFGVEDKYVVRDRDGDPITSTGSARYGTYTFWTYDWVTDIIQDPLTGEVELKGTPPAGFVFDPNKINWDIEPAKVTFGGAGGADGGAGGAGGGAGGAGGGAGGADGGAGEPQGDGNTGNPPGSSEEGDTGSLSSTANPDDEENWRLEEPPASLATGEKMDPQWSGLLEESNRLVVNQFLTMPDFSGKYLYKVQISYSQVFDPLTGRLESLKIEDITEDGRVGKYTVDQIFDQNGINVVVWLRNILDQLAIKGDRYPSGLPIGKDDVYNCCGYERLSNLLTLGWKKNRY